MGVIHSLHKSESLFLAQFAFDLGLNFKPRGWKLAVDAPVVRLWLSNDFNFVWVFFFQLANLVDPLPFV